ncbi:Cullin-domain-containing protein, partial [Rozella allomycis CSF55]
DPKAYVECLLKTYQKYAGLVAETFKGDSKFSACLDKSCREFINRNSVCENSLKSPELLARHADNLLKKGGKYESLDLEESLNQIITIFRYIEDKDVFQKFYSKFLSKRLVYGLSISEDSEGSMISKLKELCGFDYTLKLQRMFTDVNLSKDFDKGFQDVFKNSDLKMDFSSLILSTSAWPLSIPSCNFNCPTELKKAIDKITGYYNTKHSGRKLTWLHQHARGEIKASFPNSKIPYTFQVSTYQMAILLLFNDKDEITFDEIKSETALSDDLINGNLSIFLKAKILIENNGKIKYNSDYKSKKAKINLNVPIKTEQKIESEETHKNVEEDRKLYIQAAIVRIMKSRKKLKHVNLMEQVISQLQSRFKPKITDIKKCIDILLDKEYIARDEVEKDVLVYVA